MKSLVSGPQEHIEHLDLSHDPIGDEGSSYLGSVPWPKLKSLSLHNAGISEEGHRALFEVDHWPALVELNIAYWDFSADLSRAIACMRHLRPEVRKPIVETLSTKDLKAALKAGGAKGYSKLKRPELVERVLALTPE